jgi:hypothetical protein
MFVSLFSVMSRGIENGQIWVEHEDSYCTVWHLLLLRNFAMRCGMSCQRFVHLE